MADKMTTSLGLAARIFLAPCLGLLAACAPRSAPDSAPLPESHPLQGRWESDGDSGTVSVTIEGSSLYFFERPDFQYDAAITLVPDTDPPELRATLLDTPRTTDSAGEVVTAIYAFEEGTLHLAAVDKVEGEPASFDDTLSRYRLRKVQAPD